jgi:ribosome hibernation promoting factor
MHVTITFKNLDASDHFKNYLQDRLDRLDKFLVHPGTVSAVLRTEKLRKIAELNLSADRLTIHAREESEDMQAAVDLALDKIRRQITRSKGKLQDRRTRPKGKTITPETNDFDEYAGSASP